MRLLEGQNIWITGASGGIGAATAIACAKHGATVGIGYRTGEDRAKQVLEQVRAVGGDGITIGFDFSAPEGAVQALLAHAKKIDGFVNCAGIIESGPLVSLEPEQIARQVAVNLEGAILMSRAVLPHMIRNRKGSIVQVGSVSAHRMTRGHSVYSATKSALEGFTRALASEVAKRSIRVNCVLPGPVLTPMLEKSIQETGDDPKERVPLGRLVAPAEVAEAIAFLLSDRASAITGAVLPVDGGYLLW